MDSNFIAIGHARHLKLMPVLEQGRLCDEEYHGDGGTGCEDLMWARQRQWGTGFIYSRSDRSHSPVRHGYFQCVCVRRKQHNLS